MRADKKTPLKADKKVPSRGHKRGVIGYSKKSALLEDAITQMNAGKYGRSSAALKELLALDPSNMEARRLFATLHLRLGSLLPARQAFESLANEALDRQDYWLAESLLREYLIAGPRCVPFIEKLGAVYQEKGDALAASEEFAKAIDILLEDPDADRPTRPAELYAKIRELAPASPPAFRLASLFDAQSGELIARAASAPAPQPEEGQLSLAAGELSEPVTESVSSVTSDPVSDVMPWDAVPADNPVLPVQSDQPEYVNLLASSTATLSESVTAASPVSVADSSVADSATASDETVEPAHVESNSAPTSPVAGDDSFSIVTSAAVEVTVSSPTYEEVSGAEASASEGDVASLPILPESLTVSLSQTSGTVDEREDSQSESSIALANPAPDSLPAPLPWEQVEEATIAIDQAGGELLSVDLNAELSKAEPCSTVSPDVETVVPLQVEVSEGMPEADGAPLVAGAEETLSSATTQDFSPDVAWSAPDTTVTEPVGSFPVPQESSSFSPVFEQRQSDAAVEFVPPPMPWEQVQEASASLEGLSQESGRLDEEANSLQLQETTSAATLSLVPPEAIPTSSEARGAESQGSSTAISDSSAPSESPSESSEHAKVGEFSWASIFNSAWKFGSSSPAPHDSLSHSLDPSTATSDETAEAGGLQEAAVAPAVHEAPTPLASLGESSVASSASDGSVEPVVLPMPWDQIQESTVTIPSADVTPSSSVETLEESPMAPIEIAASMPVSIGPTEPVISPMPWDQIEESTVTIPLADSIPSFSLEPLEESSAGLVVPDEISHEQVPSEPMTATIPVEAFALPASVVTEEAPSVEQTSVELEEPPVPSIDIKGVVGEAGSFEEGTPLVSLLSLGEQQTESQSDTRPMPADEQPPAHSAELRVSSQTEPAPITEDSSRLDVSLAKVEPGPAASADRTTPMLPRELLPVLQTLVDQLSVVTKTTSPVAADTSSIEPVSQGQEVAQSATSLRAPSKAPSSADLAANPASAQMPPVEDGPPSQWKTGEVAVQPHRSSTNKRTQSMDQVSAPPPIMPSEEDQPAARVEPAPQIAATVAEPMRSPLVPAPEKEEWIRTGEAIRFVNQIGTEPAHLAPPPVELEEEPEAVAPSTAASAVDVLFESTGSLPKTPPFEPLSSFPKPRLRFRARLARVRIGLTVFAGSCFSTTRTLTMSIVGLAVLCVAMLAVTIGAVGLTWLVMEEKPSPAFQSLTTAPQRTVMDSSKNGYLLLLGFEADGALDPVQAGYERKPDARDSGMAAVCQGTGEGVEGGNQRNASASVAQGWYRSADPVGQFKAQADSLKSWASQSNVPIARYRQWLKMPFEDWGHGQSVAPPCAAILSAHRLYVAEGFTQGANSEAGVERLEGDMEAWRTTLSQAKTLPVKTMALQAINEDIAVASGLLAKPDFDGKVLPRMTKMLRPLDPVESSMRWPMQSQLVLAAKTYAAQLDADRGEDVPLHVSIASILPLPKQRRFNDYAEYYEASYKAAGEGRYGAMPKRSTYIKYPANSVIDYLANPIENIIGVEPLPLWDRYNGLVIDTDAHLRLASLQAWLRRGPQDADLLARIAKAGQRFYDPYTGLPMLVNLRRGVMYSVGHDGKDQDADPQQDVVVSIPLNNINIPVVSTKPASKPK